MANTSAFSFTGAGGGVAQPMSGGLQMGGATPQARALSNSYNTIRNTPSLQLSSPAPAPANQQIKSQTHTDATGATVKTDFHPQIGTNPGMLPGAQTDAQRNAAIAATGQKPVPQGTPAPTTTNGTPVVAAANNGQTSTPAPKPDPTTSSGNAGDKTPYSPQFSPGADFFGNVKAAEANVAAKGSAAATNAINASQNASQDAYTHGAAQQQQAVQRAEEMRQALTASQGNEAQGLANVGNSPIPIEFQQGRAGVLQGLYAAQQLKYANALQGESNIASLGNTSQGQGITGLGNTAANANTAQGNIQSGLASAASGAAPSGNFPFVFNPTTGQFTNGSTGATGGGMTGDYGKDSTTMASAIMGGKIGYQDAMSALSSYYGGTAESNLTKAILAAGGNPTVLKSQATAQASNIETAGTTETNTAATGFNDATQKYMAANTAFQTASQQGANVQKILSDTGINSTDLTDWNTAVNNLATRLGSANQVKYITGLNEMKQSYTNLLSSVGASTPTVNGEQATDIFDPSHTPKQIDAAITALNQAAYAKLDPMYKQMQTYLDAMHSSAKTSSSGSSSVNDPAGIR